MHNIYILAVVAIVVNELYPCIKYILIVIVEAMDVVVVVIAIHICPIVETIIDIATSIRLHVTQCGFDWHDVIIPGNVIVVVIVAHVTAN